MDRCMELNRKHLCAELCVTRPCWHFEYELASSWHNPHLESLSNFWQRLFQTFDSGQAEYLQREREAPLSFEPCHLPNIGINIFKLPHSGWRAVPLVLRQILGDLGATTIQQGIDFIVHLPGERERKRQRQRKVLDGVGIFKIFEVFPDIYELK